MSGTDHELGTDAKESTIVGPNGQENEMSRYLSQCEDCDAEALV